MYLKPGSKLPNDSLPGHEPFNEDIHRLEIMHLNAPLDKALVARKGQCLQHARGRVGQWCPLCLGYGGVVVVHSLGGLELWV